MTTHEDSKKTAVAGELRGLLRSLEHRKEKAQQRAKGATEAIPYVKQLEENTHRYHEGAPSPHVGDKHTAFLEGFAACMRVAKADIAKTHRMLEATIVGETTASGIFSEIAHDIRDVLDSFDESAAADSADDEESGDE